MNYFHQRIRDEFINGSAIAPELFESAIDFVEDTGRWEAYQALGFEVRTQWQTRKPHDFGILAGFQNEAGDYWQFKPENPLADSDGKSQKYQTPKGKGSQAFLPAIPIVIRQLISDRYGVEFPCDQSFWDFVESHPEIPIVVTEGGKKSLALLSLGYVAISLYGVNGGYRTKDANGFPIKPELTPEIARFCQPGRKITLAFDQDEKPKTRQRVNRAIARFGALLCAAGADVEIATWHPHQGKGVDDLIVQSSAAAWESAHSEALPYLHWQIWQRLENRLTWQAHLHVSTHDLSESINSDQLPDRGILAIASGKGTGKTKLAQKLVANETKVVSPSHRIALCRSLCKRLGLNYRGDIDQFQGKTINKVTDEFIPSAYSLRLGSCVESLLSINPETFAGCDLLIDEACQVVRSLLTSSTCNHDGKRPALLRRWHELIRGARRLILADADLDNATLHYFQQLRGEDNQVFLVKNDYQPQPYPVRFVQAHSFDAIVSELLEALHSLESGKTILVHTDTKRATKAIARLVANSCPEKRVLVINSETSGGEAEREFIENPDAVLARGDYDLILASPSLGTGISIEIQGVVSQVFGIFSGSSINDSDVLQSLARCREPVPRVVWAAKRGNNWSKVSRSINPLEIKSKLLEQTTATVSLIRSSLREDTIASVQAQNWQDDPNLNLYCKLAAAQNYAMANFRDCVLVRLRHEGHPVTIEDREFDPVAAFLYRQAANEQKQFDAQAIARAEILNFAQVKLLEAKEGRTPEEEKAIARYYICDFYCLDPESLTPEFVLWDAEGKRRGELRSLEELLFPDAAIDASVRALEKQTGWNQGNCPWDISNAALRSEARRVLGLGQFLDPAREWVASDLAEVAEIARQHSRQIQDVLKFNPSEKLSNTQIAHQLLSQLGVRIASRWQGSGEAKHRVYRLELQTWQALTAILERRQERRSKLRDEGSPPPLITQNRGGDPLAEISPELARWLSPESLADVRQAWELVDSFEAFDEFRQIIPPEVLERAIAA